MSAVAEEKKIVVGGSFLIEERTPEEVFTPEDFTEEHHMIAETARQFMDNEVRPRIPELEKKDWKLARELVQKGAEIGFVGATVADYAAAKPFSDPRCGMYLVRIGTLTRTTVGSMAWSKEMHSVSDASTESAAAS